MSTAKTHQAVTVIHEGGDTIKIGLPPGQEPDPWHELALLLEGIGVVASICRKSDIKPEGQDLAAYLHSYLDKVLGDYRRTLAMIKTPSGNPIARVTFQSELSGDTQDDLQAPAEAIRQSSADRYCFDVQNLMVAFETDKEQT